MLRYSSSALYLRSLLMLAHYQLVASRRERLMLDKTRQEIAIVGLLGTRICMDLEFELASTARR
jgi:hypothetical protein